jgi:hypothetical protein
MPKTAKAKIWPLKTLGVKFPQFFFEVNFTKMERI